jgi:hypothetical protein
MQVPASPQFWPLPVQTHTELSQMNPRAQALPQALQLFLSCAVSTQTPLHSVVGVGHAHFPFVQTIPPVHASPHPPQFSLLVWRFTHAFAQFVVPGSQLPLQAPRLQT